MYLRDSDEFWGKELKVYGSNTTELQAKDEQEADRVSNIIALNSTDRINLSDNKSE
jgi:hypothetical protein